MIPSIGGKGSFKKKTANPFYISTLTDESSKDLTGTNVTYLICLKFNSDGTKAFAINSNDGVYKLVRFNLATAWDITTAAYSTSVTLTMSYPKDVCYSADGNKYYILSCATGNSNIIVHEYTPTTTWGVSGTKIRQSSTFTNNSGPDSIAINPTGTKIYIAGIGSNYVYTYTLSTAYDVSTMGSVSGCNLGQYTTSVTISSDGLHLYGFTGVGDLYHYTTPNAWAFTTATISLVETKDDLSYDGAFVFSSDGTKGYTIHNYLAKIIYQLKI